MKKIIWKDIPNYEGLYQINNFGDIKSLYNYRGKGNVLKPRLKKGYYQIGLRKNATRQWYAIHRLVAETFIPNPKNLPQVNHKDENKLNNCVENLEWCTVAYNNCYGTRLEKTSNTNKLKKEVTQYDLDGNKLNTFKSIKSASKETKTDFSSISKCINNKRRTANGYIWTCESVVVPNA